MSAVLADVEIAVIDLGNGHLVDVRCAPGADVFEGELLGEDTETGEPWRMPFDLPRVAVFSLAVKQLETLP